MDNDWEDLIARVGLTADQALQAVVNILDSQSNEDAPLSDKAKPAIAHLIQLGRHGNSELKSHALYYVLQTQEVELFGSLFQRFHKEISPNNRAELRHGIIGTCYRLKNTRWVEIALKNGLSPTEPVPLWEIAVLATTPQTEKTIFEVWRAVHRASPFPPVRKLVEFVHHHENRGIINLAYVKLVAPVVGAWLEAEGDIHARLTSPDKQPAMQADIALL